MTAKKRILAVLGAAVLACAGIGAAVAATETTGTVSVCATATTPAHTVAVDGVNVATLPGDSSSQCATTTYTVPTVTETVGSTTTTSTTTTATSAPSFASETAYTQTRPSFTPTSTVTVSSGSALKTAIANLQPGDLVQATTGFTVSGGGSAPALTISKKLSSPAVIDLTGVSIVYTGGSNYPAVDFSDSANIRIYGGDLSTSDTGGVCLNLMASSYVTWWNFTAHDCGSTALRMMTGKTGYASSGPVTHDDIEGEVWKFGQNTQWSTHNEPCTGLHGANIADGNYFPVSDNRIAIYAHDSACEGAGISFGSSQSTNIPSNNTIIVQCSNLTYVSTLQTGGNCYQTWGYGNQNTDIKYLNAENLAGHPYFAGGMYSSATSANALSTDKVEYGRASKVRLNSRYANDPNYDPKAGSVFQDVAPLP